ncbi:hypothetical protein [Arthrobacter caoxuetaonis]|uniref:Uncharacterized protein n=1 Tax=Arthrobacter caoxuetaonis TaxID=2886935 RepID=A0A9X1SC47_9MICC|nr:hypothetical protein [Arthrobacter caoxuetaonis]MCC3297147.1 hypothetical protein [Arthrobacter caoxuetaonis]USQ58293.1 hypothetical protein NF551_05505 [Arthrobacter caoxuetaonis]
MASSRNLWLPAFTVLSWTGLFLHNVADLPGQSILSAESGLPLLLAAALIALWFTPLRAAAAWGMLVWAVLNTAGAVFTVLPLPVLPFDPAQTLRHYSFHFLYLLTQLPLLIASARWIKRAKARRGHR